MENEQINISLDFEEVINSLTQKVAQLEKTLAIETATKSALVRLINEYKLKEKEQSNENQNSEENQSAE
ncbi:hypothetical protein [Metabacillus niabensis]|uniref:Uncharacterized protein n=1 Tax=Metabacillus niabensis TaxID=324854 RepID=A0ABT9Z816_9BACI|nr:hypothetical protein [Metabacillus niabensis]MDQ0228404.1 hypothetical protein [Metabacillus niabensis]